MHAFLNFNTCSFTCTLFFATNLAWPINTSTPSDSNLSAESFLLIFALNRLILSMIAGKSTDISPLIVTPLLAAFCANGALVHQRECSGRDEMLLVFGILILQHLIMPWKGRIRNLNSLHPVNSSQLYPLSHLRLHYQPL